MTKSPNETEEAGHLQRLARGGTASVVGAAFAALSGIALTVVVTRGFPDALAGTLFAATSAFLILESLVLLGTDTGLVKWLPAHLASGRAEDIRFTLTVALVPMLVLSFLLAGLVTVGAPLAAAAMVGPDQTDEMTSMLRVLGLTLPVAALSDTLLAATRGMGTMRPTVIIDNVARLALQLAGVFLVWLLELNALALAVAWSFPYVISVAWTIPSLLAILRHRITPSENGLSPDRRRLAREYWWFTAPRAISRVIQAALKRSDIILVAALASAEQAAIYAAATRFVVFGQLGVQAVQQALAPQMSSLFASGNRNSARSIFQAATLWSMLGAWPVYLLTAGFAATLLKIFGRGYDAGTGVVVILSLAMLFATAAGPVDSVLLMSGRSWLSLFNSSVALALNVGLNVILIPAYGIFGAAVSWAIAIVVRNVLPLAQVFRSIHMWPGTAASGYVSVGSLVCFGVPALIVHLTEVPLMVAVLLSAAGGATYLLGIWLLREPLHLDVLRAAITRRRRSVLSSAA